MSCGSTTSCVAVGNDNAGQAVYTLGYESGGNWTWSPMNESVPDTPENATFLVAGSFPVNDVITAEIAQHCQEEGWFEHARIQSPAVIDIEELEMLEAMWEAGHSIADLIVRWKTSDGAGMSLRNWLFDTPGVEAKRSNRIQEEGQYLMEVLYNRLEFAEAWVAPA